MPYPNSPTNYGRWHTNSISRFLKSFLRLNGTRSPGPSPTIGEGILDTESTYLVAFVEIKTKCNLWAEMYLIQTRFDIFMQMLRGPKPFS